LAEKWQLTLLTSFGEALTPNKEFPPQERSKKEVRTPGRSLIVSVFAFLKGHNLSREWKKTCGTMPKTRFDRKKWGSQKPRGGDSSTSQPEDVTLST
jgi:hypothetical protein